MRSCPDARRPLSLKELIPDLDVGEKLITSRRRRIDGPASVTVDQYHSSIVGITQVNKPNDHDVKTINNARKSTVILLVQVGTWQTYRVYE